MKSRLYFWFKTYLGFSGKESRGLVLLIPLMVILGLIPNVIRYVKHQQSELIYLQYLHQLDSLEKAGFTLVASPLPTFNPQDTARKAALPKVAERINRIDFAEADSVTLQIVPGIGPSTAGRIIKYRENLGGFVSPAQLEEIYGLKPETIEAIWEYFDFSPVITKKIPINRVDLEELAKHPYVSYQEAKVILAYRKQHGDFSKASDLLKVKIFKKDWVDKIAPYLDFN
ncbi:MAG: ComEA family DNA-binding protein [Algoriphagus aquaeductus]|uniref:ComEA family DNA-binding protein n=1 Tax=Algoriphagus aquaeductus TaxID=475299 RepID=UPI00391DA1CD